MFLEGRVALLLDGEVKKRDDIPAGTLARVRAYQRAAQQQSRRGRQEKAR